ncbi:MAG: hypothetical protein NTY77_15030 [Elusimicrobia bacterium]|nr:hypothetical protein [Elusimicrobiota bacterium]
MGAWTVWPANMNTTLATVLGVFSGSKVSGLWRAKKAKEGGLPLPGGAAPDPDAPPEPVDQVAAACRKQSKDSIANECGGVAIWGGLG